jgi:urease beta subunit
MSSTSSTGPGAVRTADGHVELNVRPPHERRRLVVVNTGDRPVQIGSHLHLPDANPALEMDRERAQRFEPGASREVDVVTLRGARRVPGLQRGKADGGALGPVPGADDGDADGGER